MRPSRLLRWTTTTTPPPKRAVIAPSHLASALGLNPYYGREQYLMELWDKHSGESLAAMGGKPPKRFERKALKGNKTLERVQTLISQELSEKTTSKEAEVMANTLDGLARPAKTRTETKDLKGLIRPEHTEEQRGEIVHEYRRTMEEKVLEGKLKEVTSVDGRNAVILEHRAQLVIESAPTEKTKKFVGELVKIPELRQLVDLLEFNPAEKERIVQESTGQIRKKYGVATETLAANTLQKETGNRFEKDDKFYSIPVLEKGDWRFVLTGKIDGIETLPNGDRIIVEVKNRTKRLFTHIPTYENVQMQAYMRLTSISTCKWTQKFEDRLDSRIVKFDEQIWQTQFEPMTTKFAQDLFDLLTEPEARVDFKKRFPGMFSK